VVIHDLNVGRAVFSPTKADTVLVVQANAMLAFTVADEFLEPVADRGSRGLPSSYYTA
jgi:hypothetical protein